MHMSKLIDEQSGSLSHLYCVAFSVVQVPAMPAFNFLLASLCLVLNTQLVLALDNNDPLFAYFTQV